MDTGQHSLYPFVRFSREDWASLPVDASFSLSGDEVRRMGRTFPGKKQQKFTFPSRGCCTST